MIAAGYSCVISVPIFSRVVRIGFVGKIIEMIELSVIFGGSCVAGWEREKKSCKRGQTGERP